LEPARPALGLVELLQQLLSRIEALGGALDLLLEHSIPDADPVDGSAVLSNHGDWFAVLRACLRGDAPRKIARVAFL
jgi:hypothetical protein